MPRPLRRPRGPVLAVLGALAALACNRVPAEEAIQAAERALAAAPELEAWVPEERAAVTEALDQARASLAEGRHTDALRAALPLPDRVAAAKQLAARRERQSAEAWQALAAELPGRLEAVRSRLALLIPPDAEPSERLLAARQELAGLGEAWAEAAAAHGAGELAGALAAAQALKPKLDALAARLAPRRAAPAPAVAPAATPAPTTPTAPPAEPREPLSSSVGALGPRSRAR